VGLERGPLSLVSTIEELLERKNNCCGLESRDYTIEELLERKNSGCGLEIRDYGRRDPSR
jgi:hypothetical protein